MIPSCSSPHSLTSKTFVSKQCRTYLATIVKPRMASLPSNLSISAPRHRRCRVFSGLSIKVHWRKLTFVDTSNEGFRTNSEFMMDFHRELVARFPLRDLSLTYRAGQLDKALWAPSRAVFEPLCELPKLRSIHFVGELAVDDETIKTSLAPSWPHIESISIPQLSGDTPSCAVLSVMAKCCPRLVSLAMPIGFPDNGVLSAVEVLSHRLQILKSANTTAKKPSLIARFLDRIFPFLVRVEGGSGWNEFDSTLRDVCQPIRWDQHQRERGQ